jgi:hypothetical protein
MWSAALLLVRRPIFALLLTLAGQFLVIQVSNAKYRALREPFIFSDFGIFSQAIRHPRLYLPFLGLGRAFLAAAGAVAAVVFGCWIESPAPQFLVWAATTASIGVASLVTGLALVAPPYLDPEQDLPRPFYFDCAILAAGENCPTAKANTSAGHTGSRSGSARHYRDPERVFLRRAADISGYQTGNSRQL